MNDLKRVLRGTGVYLIGTIFTKMIQFFLLPIYTESLSPLEYGTYDLELAYATILWSSIYLDIYGGILRFIFEYKDNKEKPVYNGLLIFLSSTVLYGVFILIANLIFGNIFQYPIWIFLVGFTTVLQQVVGYVSRGYGDNRTFIIGGILGSIFTFTTAFLFLKIFSMQYYAIYLSTIIGMVVNAVYVGYKIHFFKFIKMRYYDYKVLYEMLKYSIPLSVNSVSYWLLTGANRIIIANFLSVSENGLYAIVGKFGAIISLFTQAFQMAWQELSFSKAGTNNEDLGSFYTKALNKFLIVILGGATITIPFIKFIFPILIDSKYSEAIYLVPFTILAAVFTAYSSFLSSIIGTLKKTKIIFTTTLSGAVVNIVFLLLTINILGIQSATISLTLGYFVMFIRRLQLVNKTLQVNVHWKDFIISCAVYFVTSSVFTYYGNLINVGMLFIVIIFYLIYFKEDILKIKNSLF